MVTPDYWTYCSDHIISYINVGSLCCTPEAHITLYVSYTLTKNDYGELGGKKENKRESGVIVRRVNYEMAKGNLFI